MPPVIEGGFHGGRANFGVFLNGLGLGAGHRAVELGTDRGEFAALLLERWHGDHLLCVDPYLPGYDDEDVVSHRPRGERLLDFRMAWQRLRLYGNRVTHLEQPGDVGAALVPDGSLAFVYVDACHQEQAVYHDCRTWWPKLLPGGVLAGHDFICTGEPGGGWGRYVQPAVLRFAGEVGLNVHVVPEEDEAPWSWYILKPKEQP